MESLNLGPQSKANPGPTFTMSQPAAPSSSTNTSAANPDYSTVNLADLQEFFPMTSGVMQEPALPQGNMASAQTASSFSMQSTQFRVDAPLGDEDISEFASFSEAQVPGTLDSLDMGDFADLLNPRLMNEVGNGTSMLQQSSCQQAAPHGSSIAAQSNAASQNTCDPTSNPGSTWMNYPNSIISLLQNEAMMASNNNNHGAPVLDDLDELMDEDRLISILNSGSQPGFVSGHQT